MGGIRQVSRQGIELIKRFEGLELESYRDVAGIWTIGYGHTGPEVGPGMRISEAQAEDLLIRDLQRFEDGVADGVRTRLTQSQFDALVSLSYNIGVSAFRRSTALKRINKGDFEGAAEAITWWNKATVNGKKRPILGLTRRRAAEAALFLQDVQDDDVRGGGIVVEENSPRRSNPLNSRTVGGATTAGTAGAVATGSAVIRGKDAATGGGATGAGDGEIVILDGDVDAAGPRQPSPDGGSEAVTQGCLDPDTGEYLVPEEVEAGGPLGEPIEADAAPIALEAVDPPPCPEGGEAVIVQADTPPEPPGKTDTADAVGIGAGALAVLAAIYVVAARVDDWLKFRR